MSSFYFLLFCIQIVLIQNAYSQIFNAGVNLGAIDTVGLNNYGVNSLSNGYSLGVQDVAALASLPVSGPYGGTGTGELSVGGEVQASGNTAITGQVPVIGVVNFSGSIPASGVVSVAGNCGCGAGVQ